MKGNTSRKAVSGMLPTQLESFDFIDEKYYYLATEQVFLTAAKAKRKKWKLRRGPATARP